MAGADEDVVLVSSFEGVQAASSNVSAAAEATAPVRRAMFTENS